MDYTLIRSNRRSLCVEVKDSQVFVRAPKLLPNLFIQKFLKQKERWIIEKVELSKKRNKISADEIYLLGAKRKLIFGSDESVCDDRVILKTLGISDKEKKRAIKNLYTKQTKLSVEKFLKIYDQYLHGRVVYKAYKSKWGSCNLKDELTFNIKLSMYDESVIEYVVVHELCHTKHKNHSKRFWLEVEKTLPNYKLLRKNLRSQGEV